MSWGLREKSRPLGPPDFLRKRTDESLEFAAAAREVHPGRTGNVRIPRFAEYVEGRLSRDDTILRGGFGEPRDKTIEGGRDVFEPARQSQ